MDPRVGLVIEQIGMMFDAKRFSRTAGRIFGLLILSDHPLAIDEIVEALTVSRASVSTETRRLETLGMLERSTRQGDRKDYYHVSSGHLRRMIRGELTRIGEMQKIFRGTLDVPDLSPSVHARVHEFCEVQGLIQIQLTALLNRWDHANASHSADPKKVG